MIFLTGVQNDSETVIYYLFFIYYHLTYKWDILEHEKTERMVRISTDNCPIDWYNGNSNKNKL